MTIVMTDAVTLTLSKSAKRRIRHHRAIGKASITIERSQLLSRRADSLANRSPCDGTDLKLSKEKVKTFFFSLRENFRPVEISETPKISNRATEAKIQ